MKPLLCLILLGLGLGKVTADAPDTREEGIIILQPVAGYPAAATWFVSIQWLDKDSGYVVDKDGTKTSFLNDAIGRIIYFDQAYYDEVDHNGYWVDWRLCMKSREAVMSPIETTNLRAEDSPRLASEQAELEDTIERYPEGTSLVAPLIATLKDQSANLSNGMVLQNGNWIAAKDAAVATTSTDVVPVVGDSELPVTFTTKDGKRFEDARVTVTDTGLSVLTSEGGASVAFDQLPDDVSRFPKTVKDKIADWKSKNVAPVVTQVAASPAPVVPPVPPVPLSLWGRITQFVHHTVTSTWTYVASFGSSSKTTTPASPAPAVATPGVTPTPISKPATPVAATPATPALPDLSNTVVLIKGDEAEGTGFLTRTASGPVVITNLHVIAGNPNLKIYLPNGQEIVPLSLVGASDRDLAMFAIQDNNYKYLDLAGSVDQTATVGDAAIIPGNSEGGEVTLNTNGKLVGIGPQRVEFDNPIYHGNSGGPVLDVKTGKVVAVVTGATIMSPTDALDQNSFANANSAIKGPLRYFGLRLDTVPSWQTYDQDQFIHETLFLKSFHDESRALDSYLNGERAMGVHAGAEDGAPDASFYKTNDKLRKADADWRGSGRDDAQSVQTSFQELVWTLKTMATGDVASVQTPLSFYPYDQARAKREFAYRSALIDEIGTMHIQVQEEGVSQTVNPGL